MIECIFQLNISWTITRVRTSPHDTYVRQKEWQFPTSRPVPCLRFFLLVHLNYSTQNAMTRDTTFIGRLSSHTRSLFFSNFSSCPFPATQPLFTTITGNRSPLRRGYLSAQIKRIRNINKKENSTTFKCNLKHHKSAFPSAILLFTAEELLSPENNKISTDHHQARNWHRKSSLLSLA